MHLHRTIIQTLQQIEKNKAEKKEKRKPTPAILIMMNQRKVRKWTESIEPRGLPSCRAQSLQKSMPGTSPSTHIGFSGPTDAWQVLDHESLYQWENEETHEETKKTHEILATGYSYKETKTGIRQLMTCLFDGNAGVWSLQMVYPQTPPHTLYPFSNGVLATLAPNFPASFKRSSVPPLR